MTATETLQPDDYGQVYISSPDGLRGIVTTGEVCIQYDVFADSPTIDGERANGVRISTTGEVTWIVGDLGNIPALDLDAAYNYTALGWTIAARGGALHIANIAGGADVTVTTHGVGTRA